VDAWACFTEESLIFSEDNERNEAGFCSSISDDQRRSAVTKIGPALRLRVFALKSSPCHDGKD